MWQRSEEGLKHTAANIHIIYNILIWGWGGGDTATATMSKKFLGFVKVLFSCSDLGPFSSCNPQVLGEKLHL